MTPPEHRDYATLPGVIKLIEDSATHINEEKRKSEAKEMLYSLQRKVRDCPDLLAEGRVFVYKGKLNTTGHRLSAVFKNKRSVYLFTDMLMVTSQTLSGTFCEDWALLKDIQVIDSVEDSRTTRFFFRFVFFCVFFLRGFLPFCSACATMRFELFYLFP